jgi:hypothetical protein
MARVYGEFYHASGVAKELRNLMLGSRTPEDAMAVMDWLYGEQKELRGAGHQGKNVSHALSRFLIASSAPVGKAPYISSIFLFTVMQRSTMTLRS